MLVYRRTLTASDDLDNITDPGLYRVETGNIPANSPYQNAYILEVYNTPASYTAIKQVVTRYGVNGKSAFRGRNSNTWTNWGYSVTAADDISISDIIKTASATSKEFTLSADGTRQWNLSDLFTAPSISGYTRAKCISAIPVGSAKAVVNEEGWAYNPSNASITISVLATWLFIKSS